MASQHPQKPQGLPNPYKVKGLPNPYAAAVVASAPPVRYTEEQAKAEQLKKATASKFHNPHQIKRPQAKKGAQAVKRPAMPVVPANAAGTAAGAACQQPGIDYYRSTADDDAAILEDRRQRQYEERQRKKDQKRFQKQFGRWNPQAPHKPERYSNLKAYRASGGYVRKKEDFNTFLRQAAARTAKPGQESDASGSSRPVSSSSSHAPVPSSTKPSFAPPTSYDTPITIPPPPLSQPAHNAAAKSSYQGAIIAGPPVHYKDADLPMNDADEPAFEERPAKRPKVDIGASIMAKLGYIKGQGLGKNNDGVTTPLEVKLRKAPKGASIFDDSDGFNIKSQQVWDVHGGYRVKKDEPGKFGEESSVVVTWGCVDGVDWHENSQRNDGGIRQDMGEAFGVKFGPVQQIQIDESNSQGVVYIKFESILSALNAVNRFDEGYEFRGRKIRAKYYDEQKWAQGVLEH